MVFVQYFNEYEGEFVEACGDRSVVILDGRRNINSLHSDAIEMNGKNRPKYKAYQICKGASFCRSSPITKVIAL
jgi:hypothetical protein